MNRSFAYLIFITVLTLSLSGFSQETLDANDPNTFILGGDQGSNFANLTIQPIAIVDVEPDPNNAITIGGTGNLEAGLNSAGAGDNDELWLNYTHREDNFQNKSVYVRSNMPVPNGIVIYIEIVDTQTGSGNFTASPIIGTVTLSNVNQVIVNAFGGGYTGDGVGAGYQLKYTIENNDGVSLPNGFEVIYSIQ